MEGSSERVDICSYGMEEVMKGKLESESYAKVFGETIFQVDWDVVTDILKPLAGYRLQDALKFLDSAKTVLLECTQVHEEYRR